MNNFEVITAALIVLAVLGWMGAARGWLTGSASVSVRVIPPAKRRPEASAAEAEVAQLREAAG